MKKLPEKKKRNNKHEQTNKSIWEIIIFDLQLSEPNALAIRTT